MDVNDPYITHIDGPLFDARYTQGKLEVTAFEREYIKDGKKENERVDLYQRLDPHCPFEVTTFPMNFFMTYSYCTLGSDKKLQI